MDKGWQELEAADWERESKVDAPFILSWLERLLPSFAGMALIMVSLAAVAIFALVSFEDYGPKAWEIFDRMIFIAIGLLAGKVGKNGSEVS